MDKPSRTFGGSTGVRVKATRDVQFPVKIMGMTACYILTSKQDAIRLHKRLGEALAYLEGKQK